MRKLKDLNLADNKIKEIGNGLKELNNLEILNLSANNIRYIEVSKNWYLYIEVHCCISTVAYCIVYYIQHVYIVLIYVCT